jgi:hypothetical protein
MIESRPEHAKWHLEFDAIGREAVTHALSGRRWHGRKRDAARAWLEQSDAQRWQSAREMKAAGGVPALSRFRRSSIIAYVLGVLVVAFFLLQVLTR